MTDNTSIGDRMKSNYEGVWNLRLPARTPAILRLDGRSFHTFTRDMERPFDIGFVSAMQRLAQYLCGEVATAQCAYVQSDEISLLLHNYKRLDSQGWFGNEVQKMVSVAAGLASQWFTRDHNRTAVFDARVFVLPESEVVNYFVWRQQDATRNSLSMLAQAHYGHAELHGKNTVAMHDMLMAKGVNWNDLPTALKRGSCVRRVATMEGASWCIDREIPIFTQDREYIGAALATEDALAMVGTGGQ